MYKTNLTNTLRSSCSKMNDVSSKHKFTMMNKHSVQENKLNRGEQIEIQRKPNTLELFIQLFSYIKELQQSFSCLWLNKKI